MTAARLALLAGVLLVAGACRDNTVPSRGAPPPAKLEELKELRARLEAALDRELALYERATREKKTASPRRVRAWVDEAAAQGREAAILIRTLERLHAELRDGYAWEDPYARHFGKHSAVLLERATDAMRRFARAEGPDFDPDAPVDDPAADHAPKAVNLGALPGTAADGRLGARKEAMVRRFGVGFERVVVPVQGRELRYEFDVMRDLTEAGDEPVLRVTSYSIELGAAIPFKDLAGVLREFKPALERPVVVCQSVEDRDAIAVIVNERVDLVQHIARIKVKASVKRELAPYGLGFVLELTEKTNLEKLTPDTKIWSVREITALPRPGHPAWKRLSRVRPFPNGLAAFFGE